MSWQSTAKRWGSKRGSLGLKNSIDNWKEKNNMHKKVLDSLYPEISEEKTGVGGWLLSQFNAGAQLWFCFFLRAKISTLNCDFDIVQLFCYLLCFLNYCFACIPKQIRSARRIFLATCLMVKFKTLQSSQVKIAL